MPNTVDHQPFLDQILCHPDEDEPRLIYADFLDEHGQGERAEFIRVQCELERQKMIFGGSDKFWTAIDKEHGESCKCTTHALRRRENELGEKFSWEWLPSEWCNEKGELSFTRIFKFDFHRGFIEIVEATAHAWLQWGKQIVRRQPIREVRLAETTVLPTDAARAWRLFLENSGTLRQDWEKAALLWARQEPCPECRGSGLIPWEMTSPCPHCSGKGSVDFRTLRERPCSA